MATGKIIQTDNIDGLKTVKNFISNGLATLNTTGWATYADAVATRPVDGTGGTPTHVTFTRTTTSPLSDAASFLFTVAGGSSARGEGASFDFTIDASQKAKVLKIEADYIVNSGTFVAGSSTTDSDLIVYLYDVTNSRLIEPSSFKFLSNSTTISDKFQGTFQTSSNSTSYRLIFHVASASTAAWALKVDNISVSPSQYVYGTPITDWQSYTPTVSNLGSGSLSTNSGRWRRVGDSMEVSIHSIKDATSGTGATAVIWALPTGYIIDTAKIASPTALMSVGDAYDAQSGNQLSVFYLSNTTVYLYNSSGQWNGSSFNANKTITLNFSVPILGWSSSVQMSDSADTRIIAARIGGDPASAAAVNPIIFPTVAYDTHSAYNASTGRYTAPSSGYVRVHGFIESANTGVNILIYVNASIVVRAGSTDSNGECAYTGTVKVNAGDLIDIRPNNTLDATSTSTLHFEYIQGPAAISSSEEISARYTSSAGGSIGTSFTQQSFATKSYDTHGAWNGNTFTCPSPGRYEVFAAIVATVNLSTSQGMIMFLYKNGSEYSRLSRVNGTGVSQDWQLEGVDTVECVAGDTLSIYAVSAVATSQTTTSSYNHISIKKVK